MIDIDYSLLVQIISFLIFIYLMNKLFFQRVRRIIDGREEKTAGYREKSRQMDEEKSCMLQKYEEQLLEARREVRKRIDGVLETARSETQGMIDETRRQNDAEYEKRKIEMQRELAQMRKKLAGEVDVLSDEIVDKVVH